MLPIAGIPAAVLCAHMNQLHIADPDFLPDRFQEIQPFLLRVHQGDLQIRSRHGQHHAWKAGPGAHIDQPRIRRKNLCPQHRQAVQKMSVQDFLFLRIRSQVHPAVPVQQEPQIAFQLFRQVLRETNAVPVKRRTDYIAVHT